MKKDLRSLRDSEETFFQKKAHYITSLDDLNFKASPGVNSPTIVTAKDSWSATNTHTQLPGAKCGIAVNTTNPVIATAEEGESACYVPEKR